MGHVSLEVYPSGDIVCAGWASSKASGPGMPCKHTLDHDSFGIMVAAVDGQVTVLWSRHPVGLVDIKIQEIRPATRKLKATWSTSSDPDVRRMH